LWELLILFQRGARLKRNLVIAGMLAIIAIYAALLIQYYLYFFAQAKAILETFSTLILAVRF